MLLLLLFFRFFLLARFFCSHQLFINHFRHACSVFKYSKKCLEVQVSNQSSSSTTEEKEEGVFSCSCGAWELLGMITFDWQTKDSECFLRDRT